MYVCLLVLLYNNTPDLIDVGMMAVTVCTTTYLLLLQRLSSRCRSFQYLIGAASMQLLYYVGSQVALLHVNGFVWLQAITIGLRDCSSSDHHLEQYINYQCHTCGI